jgi:Flp pilus assembly secretin CpaC/tetratricopeptide (TPR) repeat protein
MNVGAVHSGPFASRLSQCVAACFLLATLPGSLLAQSAGSLAQTAQGAASVHVGLETKPPSNKDRRRAAKLFLDATALFEKEHFKEAMRFYQQASLLDPTKREYPLAEEVARNHAVTALIQQATKDRIRGDAAAARTALSEALALNPQSMQASEHLYELGNDALANLPVPLYEKGVDNLADLPEQVQATGIHSFHLRIDQRQAIPQIFKAYGLEATLDESVHPAQIHFDIDDATFAQATRALQLITKTFYVPLDAHRVIVARDTHDNRQQFERQELETVYLSGLSPAELSDISSKVAKDIFGVSQAVVDPSANTITLRAPANTLNAFNATMRPLLDGRSQVILDVRMIQLAHTTSRNTGAQLPQSMSAYNIYTEEQSILNANQALIQQIVQSGLAAPGDTLAIIGILIASGQVSSSLFSGGIATFGGGLTASALSPGGSTANLSLNSSDSRLLDQVQLRLGDGEDGKLRLGERYPIQTSSFSSGVSSGVNIPGLTGAGASGALSGLLSGLTGSSATVPMIEYQDLGLTLKTTPRILRNGEVALKFDMQLDALAGSSINDVPVLSNTAFSGTITLKEGEGVVVASELDKSQSNAISGTPGISEIPGLNNLTGVDKETNTSTLLIIVTPHVIRSAQMAGHTPMIRIEKDSNAR